MKTLVRLADEKDAPSFFEWMKNTAHNLFDPAIATYRNLRTLVVDINDKPAVFIPFHPVMVIESLAHKPDISKRENAYALTKAQAVLQDLASVYGLSEIWWMCADDSLIQAAQHYGYEVVKTTVLRKKITPNV